MTSVKFVKIRFYEELNDFLPIARRKKTFRIEYSGKQTVKDLIESEGVPHVEVDLILVNGQSVDFMYHVQSGDQISVYPVIELLDISSVNRLRPAPLRITRFMVDANLGRLARYLRMLGFNTLFDTKLEDDEIIRIASTEKRIILTRDLGILKNGKTVRGYFVRNQSPPGQISEVIHKFDLKNKILPFSRCMSCNGPIVPVDKKKVIEHLGENTKNTFDEFFQCKFCGKIYWKGSHYERMLEKIESLINNK